MAVEQAATGKPVIRAMGPSDIGVIFDIDRSLTGVERAVTHSDLISGDLGNALDLSVVAAIGDRVIGFALARHVYIGEPVVEAGLIQGLGVHPLHQRQGIAAWLVSALTEHCQSRGIKTLRVVLSDRDSQMEGFFDRMGFHHAQLVVYDKTL